MWILNRLLGLSFLPMCILVCAMTFSLDARPGFPAHVLEAVGEDVHLSSGTVDAFVHFREHSDGLELHILIHDRGDEGSVLRTRVVLLDGQTYCVRLPSRDEAEGPKEEAFLFRREGRSIIASVLADDVPSMAGFPNIFP
ncbi:MAG: hypothetical protein AAGH68_07235 [Pseudomonadota bacterium]